MDNLNPMENLTQDKKWEFKDLMSKKVGTILLIAWASVLTIFIIYQFGWKKLENSIYQKGVLAGKNEINTMVMTQLQQMGGIRINVPDSEGKVQTIFLVPQRNGTTTQ